VIATAFGFAVAFVIYLWRSSRGALRFIDLVSFAIGFLALCAGLFAVYNYKGDSAKNNHRWTFKLALTEATLDTQFDMITYCERIPHTPYSVPPIRTAECKKLEQYLKTLKVNEEFPIALQPPNLDLYTDSIVQRLARHAADSVASANEAIRAYNQDVQYHAKLTLLESLFRELALPVLAWAFGLGIGRRTIDLYRDMSDTSQQRLHKFSGYNLVQPVVARSLTKMSDLSTGQLGRLKTALRFRKTKWPH
jgi:hypothetical protein